MLKYLILFANFICVYSACQCNLGYRNGASSSDTNLCMGPSEGGKRPCYPTPCNADWTPCTNQEDNEDTLWTKESTHTGKRPDCPFIAINDAVANYLWNTLNKCKEKCIDEPTGKCNMVSRYGDTVKSSTEPYHCRFYACPDPENFNWITQTQWGNYASTSNTYKLLVRHYILNENIVNSTRWTNKTRWINKTRWTNKTRWINQTRLVNKYVDKTRWTNKTRWINQTRLVDKFIDKTRWTNKTRWINQTNIIYKTIVSYVYKNNSGITVNNVVNEAENKTNFHESNGVSSNINCQRSNNLSLREIYFIIIIIIIIVLWILREIFRKYIKKKCCPKNNETLPSIQLRNVVKVAEATKIPDRNIIFKPN
jgi:hypothetical protein